MDRERFDALARLFATRGSRRAAIGALLGTGLLGTGPDGEARKGKGKDRGGKSKGQDKGRGKERRKNTGKARKRNVRAEVLPANCCSTNNCTPGPGKNLGKCCYEDGNVSGANFKGANLGSANFTGADATNANFTSANLGKACLVDANLTGATIDGSTNTGGAIFCRTTMPDGSVNDAGCNKSNRCCQTCIDDGAACGPDIGGSCCHDCCEGTCTDTQTDPSNCGGCGIQCNPVATCESGECVIVVTPADLRGWQFYQETPPPEHVIATTFESGPSNPPRGDGSAELKVTEPPNTTIREGKLLSANILVGTPLADLDILEYTVYVTSAASNTAPSLQLGIDFDGNDANNNAGFQGRMVYVPSATGAFPQGQWITIDALANNGSGNWFFTRSATFGQGHCPANNPCNFLEILGHFPDIRIFPVGAIGPGAGLGFIGFKTGSGEGSVEANVDSIKIKLAGANEPITVYDFELNS